MSESAYNPKRARPAVRTGASRRFRLRIFCCGSVIALAAMLRAGPANLLEELAMQKPLRILRVKPAQIRVGQYARCVIEVDFEGSWTNPFDSRQVRLDARIVPVGDKQAARRSRDVPGFLYRPYSRALEKTKDGHTRETLRPAGAPVWRFHLSFSRPGRYRVTVTGQDASGTVTADPVAVTVRPTAAAGFVRRRPGEHRFLVCDRGESVFLIGANVCWGGPRGTYSYDEWLPQYARNGCNFFRIWLSPGWTTFAMNTTDSGFDHIDLANAWRLDRVLGQAEQLGLRAMLCIDSFNILRSRKKLYGCMETSPYYVSRGGPVSQPADYFASPVMRAAYRDRLRYLVARYGCSTAVLAWEFWNEVDLVDRYDSALATRWHRDMARFLRNLDPWNHPITTSTARANGDPRLDALPELDIVQTHHYGARDMAVDLFADTRRKKAARDRPHFHGEFGISHSGAKTAALDPGGIHLHNGIYAAAVQLEAGTPMSWWWDSYIQPRKLYHIYGAFARWIDGFDFAAEQVEALDIDCRPAENHKIPPLRGWGIGGRDGALLWFQNPEYTWDKMRHSTKPLPLIRAMKANVRGLKPGSWRGTWFDTRTGEPANHFDLTVRTGQPVEIALPAFARDAALRLTRQ